MTQPSTRILIIGAGILSDCLKREASRSPPRPPGRGHYLSPRQGPSFPDSFRASMHRAAP